MENDELPDLGPFTLDEAKEWLHKVEDDAWAAGSNVGALEFILGNLLLALDKAKVIDVMEIIHRLQAMTPMLEVSPRLSADLMLAQLLSVLSHARSGDTNGYVLH